jgi:hypothetical protein
MDSETGDWTGTQNLIMEGYDGVRGREAECSQVKLGCQFIIVQLSIGRGVADVSRTAAANAKTGAIALQTGPRFELSTKRRSSSRRHWVTSQEPGIDFITSSLSSLPFFFFFFFLRSCCLASHLLFSTLPSLPCPRTLSRVLSYRKPLQRPRRQTGRFLSCDGLPRC